MALLVSTIEQKDAARYAMFYCGLLGKYQTYTKPILAHNKADGQYNTDVHGTNQYNDSPFRKIEIGREFLKDMLDEGSFHTIPEFFSWYLHILELFLGRGFFHSMVNNLATTWSALELPGFFPSLAVLVLQKKP